MPAWKLSQGSKYWSENLLCFKFIYVVQKFYYKDHWQMLLFTLLNKLSFTYQMFILKCCPLTH